MQGRDILHFCLLKYFYISKIIHYEDIMLSFPSTINQGGINNTVYDKNGYEVRSKTENQNMFDVSRIKVMNMNLSSKIKQEMLSDGNLDISMNNYRIKRNTMVNAGMTQLQGQGKLEDNEFATWTENPYQIPASILSTMNRYTRVYKTPVTNLMNAGAENTEMPDETVSSSSSSSSDSSNNSSNGSNNSSGGSSDSSNNSSNNSSSSSSSTTPASSEATTKKTTPDAVELVGLKTTVVSSIFNPIHVIQVNGFLDNLPMINVPTSSGIQEVNLTDDPETMKALKDSYYDYGNANIHAPQKNTETKKTADKSTNTDTSTNTTIKKARAGGSGSSNKKTPPKSDNHAAPPKDEGQKKETPKSKLTEDKDLNKKTIKQFYDSFKANGNESGLVIDENGMKVRINYNPFNQSMIEDSANCTIRELVNKSHTPNGILGLAKYKYSDFLFCKNIGKVSNNHMITLRRFAHPVGDNIFRFSGKGYLNEKMPGYHGHQENGSIGTLVTWFGTDDNKLEDILSYSVQSSWVEFNSKIDEIDTSDEDNSANGIIGMFANSFNPAYNSLVARGMAGSNSLWTKTGSAMFGATIGKIPGMGSRDASDGSGKNSNSMNKWKLMYMSADKNKIYTPQNTIQATHKYEGKLTLQHEFTLNFSYRLRALDVMNPKAVMLDLIGNILEVTYNRGHFWGGSRRFIGPPRNTSSIAKANAFIDRQWEKLEGFIQGFANGTIEWQGILASLSDVVSQAVNAVKDMVSGGVEGMKKKLKDGLTSFKDGAQKLAGKFISTGASRAILGQLKNSLGRPSVYVMDSLLDGAPVGLWHVTIGNPKNPIAAFGNLIMTTAKITHSGPLGFDDFPTELKVSCTLKHGRSRDLSEVARMYTKGSSAFYNALDKNKLSEFFTVSNTETGRKVETEITNANYARGLAEQYNIVKEKLSSLKQEEAAARKEVENAERAKADADKKAKEEAKNKQKEDAAKTNEQKKTDPNKKDTTATTETETKKGGTTGKDKDKNKTPKKGDGQTDPKKKDPPNTSTTQQTVGETSNTGTTNTPDPEQQLKSAKEKLNNIIQQEKELEKLQEAAKDVFKDQSTYGDYVDEKGNIRDNYSTMFGNLDKLKEQMKLAKDPKSTVELYRDSEKPQDNLYGHFIRNEWALRYETLGQDLDTEGRLMIDENA